MAKAEENRLGVTDYVEPQDEGAAVPAESAEPPGKDPVVALVGGHTALEQKLTAAGLTVRALTAGEPGGAKGCDALLIAPGADGSEHVEWFRQQAKPVHLFEQEPDSDEIESLRRSLSA
ncbi:MAG: hypothetical protein AB7S38_19240 [Vulcanimicrobiota bacterium]